MEREGRHRGNPFDCIVRQPGDRAAVCRIELDAAGRGHPAGPVEHEHQGEAGVVGHRAEARNRLRLIGRRSRCHHSAGGEQVERLRHGCREDPAGSLDPIPPAIIALDIDQHPSGLDRDGHRLHPGSHDAPFRAPLSKQFGELFGKVGHAPGSPPAGVAVGAGLPPERAFPGEAAAPFDHGPGRLRLGHDPAEGTPPDRKKLGPVIADRRADPPGGDSATDAPPLVEHEHPPSGCHEFPRGRQPCNPGPHHHGIPVAWCGHAPSTPSSR